MEAIAIPQSMAFLVPLLLFLCMIDIRLSQPISFNSTVPFNKTTESQFLSYEGNGGLFIWPLHQDPAIFNLSLLSSENSSYHSVSAAYLGYVSNTITEPAYVLSVVITGANAGSDPSQGMIVWMANRDNPIRDADPTLAIDQDGHLVLQGRNKELVWWTNATGNRFELRGDGNLLLYDGVGQSGVAIWQSFDYPDDTLTVSQVFRQGSRLRSRASTTDLSTGASSLIITEYVGCYFFYSQDGNPDSVIYNRFQALDKPCDEGLISCAVIEDLSEGLAMSFYCVKDCNNNRRPASFMFQMTLLLSTPATNDTIPIIIRLLPDGDLVVYQQDQFLSWRKSSMFDGSCDLPIECPPYSTCFPHNNSCSATCTTDSGKSCMLGDSMPTPTCQNPDIDNWEMGTVAGRTYISNDYEVPLNVTGPEQCKDKCFRNCSCTASFYDPASYYDSPQIRGCYLITQKLLYLTHEPNSSYLAFIKIPSPKANETASPKANEMPSPKANKHVLIIVVTLVSSFILSSVIILMLIILKIRRKPRENVGYRQNEEEDDFLQDALHTITRFSYQEIESMTNGFSTKLGSGGFGSVYDGLSANGQKVAVKRLDSISRQGSKEFRAEVAIMAGIHHRNLVDLLGFCADNLHLLLVYEHMPFGSLDRWLFNTNNKNQALLTWPQRFKIAVGIANGLAYLHEECTKKIIHLDVKPQNILLDGDFNAKVGDFGLSRLLSREESFALTTMRGTPGYLAPEWLREGGVTEKMDVYSFGMVLLELVSGRKNYEVQLVEPERRYFPAWAFEKLKEGKEMELLDPKLAHQLLHNLHSNLDQDHEQYQDGGEVMQFKRIIHVAFLCVQEEFQCRPQMSSVAKMLEGREMMPPLPFDHGMHGFLRSRAITTTPINTIPCVSSSLGPR